MSTDNRLRILTGRFALVLLLAVGGLVAHRFSLTVGRAPALAFDDALASVSANVAREGRLGFDAVPVNTLAVVSQNDHFFNYGPWYFIYSAVFDWAFGTSYEVHRWAHLLGVMLSVFLASLFFRDRDRFFATALYGCGALLSFHYHQWPMARPDIFGTIGASLALVFASRMFKGGGRGSVFGFGLSVGLAITNHPIVAALGPWSFLVLLAVAGLEEPARRWGAFKRLVPPWLAGLMIAGLGLVAASGFRPGAILKLYFLYPSFVQRAGSSIGFFGSIDHHLSFIGLEPGWAQAAAAILLVVVSIDVIAFIRRKDASAWISLLPGTACAAYVLSLGVFRNTHEGYEILVQMLFLWTVAAFMVRVGHGLPLASSLLVPVASLMLLSSRPGRWENQASVNVPYREYIDAVRSDIPVNARVQGEAIFGLGRANWVETAHAALLTGKFLPRFQDRFAPDFLVLSEKEWELDCLNAQNEAEPRLYVPGERKKAFGSFFRWVPWLFRDSSFRLVRIVSAPPYRTTRVYRRVDPETDPPPRPDLATWTPEGLWQHNARDQGVSFVPEDEMVVALRPGSVPGKNLDTKARTAWTADLGEGTYLVEVTGLQPATISGCVVTASTALVGSRKDLLSATPRFPRDRVTYQVIDHPGGPLHVGVLSPDPSDAERLHSVVAYRIAAPPVPSLRRGPDPATYPEALVKCLNGGVQCLPPEQ